MKPRNTFFELADWPLKLKEQRANPFLFTAPGRQKATVVFESFQASPACPSDKDNIQTKISYGALVK
jgi:hypothetical protein